MTTAAPATSTTLAVRALQALGSWQRLQGAHFSASMGCACGPGFDGITGSSIELDLIEYLTGWHGHEAALKSFWPDGLQDPPAPNALARLLQMIVEGRLPAALAEKVLTDLERALASLTRSHFAVR